MHILQQPKAKMIKRRVEAGCRYYNKHTNEERKYG